MKRATTSFHQFVQRIPADIKGKVRGTTVAVRVGDETVLVKLSAKAQDVRLSLRTRDPQEARERQAAAIASLERAWRAVRTGPVSLSFQQTVALAGEWYREMVAGWSDDPGEAAAWEDMRAHIVDAQLDLERDETPSNWRRLEDAVHPSPFLRSRGVELDETTKRRFLREAGKALTQAAGVLERNADGDYRPDPDAMRFPEWNPIMPVSANPTASKATGKLTIDDLFTGWWTEAKATGLKPSTHESYRSAFDKLRAFLKHDNASAITPADIVAFKDHRLASINPRTGKPISPKTVKDSDLTGLKAVFAWAVANHKLPSNPAAGVTLRIGKVAKLRSKDLNDAEAEALLSAARNLRRGNEREKTFAAKRWVPWLCAYTGARVGELTQLRKEDVRQDGDIWVLRITPEAGTVKTNEARDVPLHADLITQGFAAFVGASKRGHLFLDPAEDGDVLGPLQGVKNRLGEFARGLVTDPNVAPNHGWRHRFKTVGRELGISDRVLDAIQGHAPKTAGDSYGDVTLRTRAAAIAKFPKYSGKR
ncbi:DUF6538 domain-containing protein [Aureimonas psammosilenae]|uniref:DUF6538 domain-containing protein n=1 Tax=Aureimonas psammosilenae TaxID=2495496 RepID=UPI001260D54C|nr:DUF6538 domain-containing protein [Aureimonas psammosilenae]